MPILCRHKSRGLKLDVAGLNEITVLIDRSETELTEVAMNSWTPDQDGPPHAHPRKEQNFLVTSGRGEVVIGGEKYAASPGDFFYIPAGVVHQTITQGTAPLEYFLFNAFLDTDKEGHASFADHISKVKETRRQQAAQQRAEADTALASAPANSRRGLRAAIAAEPKDQALLPRQQAERSEALVFAVAPGGRRDLPADKTKEQVLFVLTGRGQLSLDGESAALEPGQVVFVPRGKSCSMTADAGEALKLVSFGTVLSAG